MTLDEFRASLTLAEPPRELPAPLAALWWDAKGDWARAHGMVDDLETRDAMAVHAYLHRKEGVAWNADYWYSRAGRKFHRPMLDAEWQALVEGEPLQFPLGAPSGSTSKLTRCIARRSLSPSKRRFCHRASPG